MRRQRGGAALELKYRELLVRTALRIVVSIVLLAIVYVFASHAFPRPMARATMDLQRFAGDVERKALQIPGFELAYLDGGHGEPLVLVHGIGADKDNFAPIALFLRGVGRVLAPDLPGFSESSKPPDGDYSIGAQAERLGQFLDALKLPRAHFGGHSMGGAIVLEFARCHPERVRSLWLLDPAVVGSAKESEMFRAWRERGEMLLFAKSANDLPRIMHLAISDPLPLPYSVVHELGLAAAANYPLHTRIFRELIREMPHREQDVASLATPTLIIWGQQDRVLDVSGAEILHQVLPNSQVVLMPAIGHMPMLEAPQHTASNYKKFRAGLPPAATS